MHHAINKYSIRLDVQHFVGPVYYIFLRRSFISHLGGCNLLSVGKTAKFGVRSSEVAGKLNLNLVCVMNIIIRL